MAKTLQHRRDTTTNLGSEAGAIGEFFMDTTKNTVVVMDGSTAGGHPLATESYVDTSINNLIGGAPGALDTLNELAAALNDDANAYTTLSNSIAAKQDTLVSGTSIKTVNGTSLLGSGNLTISGYTDSDVDAHLNQSNPSNGYVLSWDATVGDYAWVAQASGGSSTLASLTDVTLTNVAGGNYLYHNGTNWQNVSPYILFNTATSATFNSAELTISGQYITANDSIKFQGDDYVRVWRPSDDTIRIQLTDEYVNNVAARKNQMEGLTSDVIAAYASAYDLGSKTIPWYDLYIDHAIQFGDASNYVRLVGTPDGLITPTFLIGDLLLDSNTITPVPSSALPYYGDLGVLDLNGNLDGSSGHWMHAPTVATENVTTTTTTNNVFPGLGGLYGIEFADTFNNTGETRMVFYFTNSGADSSWASWTDPSDPGISAPGFEKAGDRLYFEYPDHYYGQVTETDPNGSAQNTLRAGTYFIELLNDDNTGNDLSGLEFTFMGAGGLANPGNVSWSRSIAVQNITGIYRVNEDGSETAVGWSWAGGLPSDLLGRESDLGDFQIGNYETNGYLFDYVSSNKVYKVSNVYQKESVTSTSPFVPATTGKEGFVRYNKDETALQVYTDAWKNVSVDVPEKILFTETEKDGNGNLVAEAGKTYLADGGVNFYWPTAWAADPVGTTGEYYKILNHSIDNSVVFGMVAKPSAPLFNHTITASDKVLYVVNDGAYGIVIVA